MSDVPWQTDRALDTEMVRDVVRSQFPPVEAATIEPIGDGWDFDVYEIDGRWVFRFPKRHEYDSRFLVELALLLGHRYGSALESQCRPCDHR